MVTYTLCDTAVVPDHNPLFVPDFDSQFDIWPAIVVRIGRLGKSIAPRFAHRYVDAMAGGVIVQAHHILRFMSSQGMPWMEGVSFDNAAPHGAWISCDLDTCSSTPLRYTVTSLSQPIPETPPADATAYPLSVDLQDAIPDISCINTLKNGDLLYIACTPQSLIATPDTRLTIWLGDRQAASIRIK